MNKIFYLLLAAVAMVATGCEEQPTTTPTPPQDDDETVVIIKQYTLTNSENPAHKGMPIVEDTNHRYNLRINRGNISIVPYYREGEEFSNSLCADMNLAGLRDVGEVDNIELIEECEVAVGEGFSTFGEDGCEYCAPFQPSHGYVVTLTLDEGMQRIALFTTSHTLHDDGSLFTVSLRYKQF